MFARASISQFETQMRVFVSRDLPEQARKAMAAQARATVQRVETEQRARSGGTVPTYVPIVDGARGAGFDAVKPDGVIALDWNYMAEAVKRTVAYLREHGPEVTGMWKRNIWLEVDGVPLSPSAPIPKGSRVAYVGPDVPYARRLELGSAVQVPAHFVESCALQMKRQLVGIAKVDFTYASFAGANTQMTRKELRDSRVPAIRLIEVAA